MFYSIVLQTYCLIQVFFENRAYTNVCNFFKNVAK